MAPPIISLRDIQLSWGANPVFAGLDLHVSANDRLCLIGRNGAGKSTLLKVIAGDIHADAGERWVQPGSKIAYLPQEPDASAFKTLGDFIAAGMSDGDASQDYRVDKLVADLNVDREISPQNASGGELRRAALARALIDEPDLLLLDEPTNHLDIAMIEWLEHYLRHWQGALVFISHDRAFMGALARACLWLDRGQVRRLDDRFEKFDAWQEDELGRETLERKKLDKLIKEETRWSVEGISARRTRNQGRLRRLHALRAERASQINAKGSVEISLGEGAKSGAKVIEAKNISKRFGERALFSGFSTRIARGDRVGIIGSNGVGKSTLLKILTGELSPDDGSVVLGTNLQPIIIDQKRSELQDDMTVADTIAEGGDWVEINGERKHVRSYMKDFLFDADQANTPVSALSGGERNRLLLAANFAKPSNLLILDEPTNDLDMDTLDLLQEILADYPGTILLVSHDRDFLDRVVTSSIVLEGNGEAVEYSGGYSDYLAQKRESAATEKADRPSAGKVTNIRAAKPKKMTKLSYKDQRELDTLPAEVEALSRAITDMEAELSDPGLYERDNARFVALSEKVSASKDDLEAKELRWLELEELKESLTGQ